MILSIAISVEAADGVVNVQSTFNVEKTADRIESILKEKGITLYLASGTDGVDVQREAELMGYASFFDGGIHGSTGNPDEDPKRMVIRKIIGEIGESHASRIVTFGDGPVEIRETRKRGGFCVGLVSDEVKRHGINPAKRSRLVLAGSDILIPDFSYTTELENILFTNQQEQAGV